MKDFVKMLLAVMAGMLIFSVIWVIMMFSFIGSIAALSSSDTPVIAKEGVLNMDLSNIVLSEQEQPFNFNGMFSKGTQPTSVGIWNAVQAVKILHTDCNHPSQNLSQYARHHICVDSLSVSNSSLSTS